MSRSPRLTLGLVGGFVFLLLLAAAARGGEEDRVTLDTVKRATGAVRLAGGVPAPGTVRLERNWEGPVCRARLRNTRGAPVRIAEVLLASIPHRLPPETRLYGEGFQMLSQTGGTLGQPVALGNYTDVQHYRLAQPEGAVTVYGLLTLAPPGDQTLLFAFTSCRRFSGRFDVRERRIDVVLDTEGLELAPGQAWELEEFTFRAGRDRAGLLAELAERINRNHPPLHVPRPPTGWCSWYCFGPRVTEAQVRENLDAIAREVPALKYVQIDDGYQSAMGDWLETGPAFGGGVQAVLEHIRRRGFEPAIWVAPFIAEENSRLFREHPDWFMKDDAGKPLPSNRVTFGGWRHGPWYALDGTHPAAQAHLERVFRTMRREWGCTYFKLDANFWGAMPGGRLHDPKATRIEAYRRGMEAVRRGAGDGFLLGCNHPIWPSFGLIHGSRSSGDINRTWNRFAQTARENLSRNWQNGRLWWNDPDCVLLTGSLSEAEFQFHATALYATGGMLLSGDDLAKLPPERLARLRRLLPPTGRPARFTDAGLQVGRVALGDRQLLCLFNWSEIPQDLTADLPQKCRLTDFWSGEELGSHAATFTARAVPPYGARLLVCWPSE
jgi:alpha-galactosidase